MSAYLTKADTYDIQQMVQRGAKVTEVAKAANHEVAQVGTHAVNTMANVVREAGQTRNQLTASGHRSDIYDDAQSKIVQVTGQNLITLANTAQKEIMQEAARMMR
jgi:hypothetical protein